MCTPSSCSHYLRTSTVSITSLRPYMIQLHHDSPLSIFFLILLCFPHGRCYSWHCMCGTGRSGYKHQVRSLTTWMMAKSMTVPTHQSLAHCSTFALQVSKEDLTHKVLVDTVLCLESGAAGSASVVCPVSHSQRVTPDN